MKTGTRLSSPALLSLIEVPEVDLSDSADLMLIKSRVGACPSLFLGQSWLPLPEPGFESGVVHVGLHGPSLFVFAEFQDAWIHNPETEQNAMAFLRGDTFEIFLRGGERTDYWEFHVTPQNVIFQAHFPMDISLLRKASELEGKPYRLADFLVYERKFFTRTWIGDGVWNVLAAIPLDLLGLPLSEGRPSLATAHFARYDYPKNRRIPILSSTGQFSGPPNFHDQSGWASLDVSGFQASKPSIPLTSTYSF